MPKKKSKKSVLKRFRQSSRGKVKFQRAGRRHLAGAKNSKRRRGMRKPGVLGWMNNAKLNEILAI